MTGQSLKLLLVAGIAAVLGASFLSSRFEANVSAAPASSSSSGLSAPSKPVQRSWFGGLFDGISFRSSSQPVRQPARPQRVPRQQSGASGFGAVMIAADSGGQFNSRVEIDGRMIPMLVDTGATVVALRAQDARRLGINPMPSDYTVKISTANGDIRAARTRLRAVRIENITVHDVDAVVMPERALGKSLLGMSFLRKLSRFEVASGNLVLRP